jgi:hypothetical protein
MENFKGIQILLESKSQAEGLVDAVPSSYLRKSRVCTALLQKFQSSILTFGPRKQLTTSSYMFPGARR